MTAPVRTGAGFKRGKSRQDQGTPWDFIRAVERRYGPIAFDLAASDDNAKADRWFTPKDDALVQCWHRIPEVHDEALRWLNPPFARIGPWAEKCAHESALGCRVAFLVPAGVGSEWFAEHVHGKALVRPLRPRLIFEGEKDPYPKDLILCLYGERPGFEPWRWR